MRTTEQVQMQVDMIQKLTQMVQGLTEEQFDLLVAELEADVTRQGFDMTDETSVLEYMNIGDNWRLVLNRINKIKGGEETVNTEKKVEEKVIEFTPVHPDLEGPQHDAFIEMLKSMNMFQDCHIHAALTVFPNRMFRAGVRDLFDNDDAQIGEYFRGVVLGKEVEAEKHVIRTTGFVTADILRNVGDGIEWVVTEAVSAINYWVFQKAGDAVDNVAKRPEELKEYDFVKDFSQRIWKKAQGSVTIGNTKFEPQTKEDNHEL